MISSFFAMKNLSLLVLAFVLWSKFQEEVWTKNDLKPTFASYWAIISETPDHAECQQKVALELERLAIAMKSDSNGPAVDHVKSEKTANTVSQTTYYKHGTVNTESHRLFCLPDTVDPRGPGPKS
jgi:hypothetical protein